MFYGLGSFKESTYFGILDYVLKSLFLIVELALLMVGRTFDGMKGRAIDFIASLETYMSGDIHVKIMAWIKDR